MRAAPFAMSFDPPMLSLNQCEPQLQQASLETNGSLLGKVAQQSH